MHRGGAVVVVAVGLDAPPVRLAAADRIGTVEERRRGVVGRVRVGSLLDRFGKHEGLEGRARLPARLRGEVELERLLARDDGVHGANRARARVDRDDRGGGVALVVEGVGDRLASELLEAAVDRRVDAQPAGANGVRAVLAQELLPDVAEEVRLVDPLVQLTLPEPQIGPDRRPVLRACDVAVRDHRPEHGVAPGERALGLVERVEDRRRLREACEQCRLREREVAGPAREVGLRGGLDAVRVVAEVDLVQVLLEDLVLRPAAVQLDRQAGLGDLSLERDLLADVEVPDELLGDRGAALHDLPRADVGPGGAQDAGDVDSAVVVEAPILDREDRLTHVRAHRLERDGCPVLLGGDRPEERVVGGVDERVLPDRDRAEVVEVAALVDLGCAAEACDSAREAHQHDERHEQHDQLATAMRARLAAVATPTEEAQLERIRLRAAAAPRAVPRAHPRTPAARRRAWAWSRSSLSSRSTAAGSSAEARTVTTALSGPRSLIRTAPRGASSTRGRSASTAADRSLSRGTLSVTWASFSRLTMEAFLMVSEASFSFGITSRTSSCVRMKV